MTKQQDLRERAERCRDMAEKYATQVGDALARLAEELEREAQRLDDKEG